MRACLVSNEVAGIRGGGIGTYVVEAGYALRAAGHEVWLITARPDEGEDAAWRDAFDQVRYLEDAAIQGDVEFGRARRVIEPSHRAHTLLTNAGVEFDYIEFADYEGWGYTPLLEQRLFRTYGNAVTSVVLHSPLYEIREFNEGLHSRTPALREQVALEDEAISRALTAWSPSKRLRELVATRLGLPGDFAEIIRYPMRLDPDFPQPPESGRRLEDLKFLYFGRIEPRKGVREIVDAFTRMPELSIELVGDDLPTAPFGGSEIEYLQKKAGPNITFTGALPREEMLEHLQNADVVVLPSPWENWPNTCIESMAAARVVIGSSNGGMGEMIQPGQSGFLVEGGNADDLVRVMRDEVGAALDRLESIGRAAAIRIRELSDPPRYVASIEALVANRRPKPLPTLTERPLVSVITPFYNEDLAMVGAAIDSAIAQDYDNLELLVIDDGSPRDDADATLAALEKRDPRVRVLRKPNGGLGSARNHGLARARGDFILCLDADNVLRPEYARTGVEILTRETSAMAVSPQMAMFGDGSEHRVVVQGIPYSRPLAVLRNSMGDAGAMFRASVFRDHGLNYDETVHGYEDWALWLDMAARDLQVLYVPRVLYDYRIREGSLMNEHGWDRHLHLLSLLIERHLPPATTPEEEKDVLTALVHGWGIGALLAGLGRHEDLWERPAYTAERIHKNKIRYTVADFVANSLNKVPGLKSLLRPLLKSGYEAHGRYKDRKRRK